MIKNSWQLFYFKPFKAALDELERAVTTLAQRDPTRYKTHPKTRLLAALYRAIVHIVPTNPNHADFRLGKRLGADYGNWRHVKKGMPDRYRLFFRFASSPIKVVAYVWFNDEHSLRRAKSKTDVYEAFRRMLLRGEVPTSIEDLLMESRSA